MSFQRRTLRRLAAVLSGSLNVGDFVWFPMPDGQVGQIQVQRNGVDIAPVTAVIGGISQVISTGLSSPGVGAFQYRLVAADIGAAITARVIGAAYETSAPRVYQLEIPLATPNKTVTTYDEGLDPSSVPAPGDFTIGGTLATAKTCTAVAITGNIVTKTWSSNFVPGDFPLETYTPGTHPLRDLAHTPNAAPAYTAMGVWNNYPVPAEPVILMTTEPNYTAGAGGFLNTNGAGFWGFEPTLASFQVAHPSQPNFAAVLDGEGWSEFQITDSNAAIRECGFWGQHALNFIAYCAHVTSGVLQARTAATPVGPTHTFTSPSSLCRARVCRHYPTGIITVDYSEDGALTWTTLYTFADTVTDVVNAAFFTSSTTVPIIGAALQGYRDRGY